MRNISDLREGIPPLSTLPHSTKTRRMEDGSRKTWQYIDIPLSFDCETYSFTVLNGGGLEKRAIMWAWGLAVNDECYMGRTWGEFLDALETLIEAWDISPEHRCIIWVHNLSYDFQFFRKWLKWEQIFALSSREVCYVLTDRGIEFRCSYILTGYSLEKVGEHLTKHTMKKLTGTIDYVKPRHPGTPLTPEEVAYLEHDCLVVTAHIAEQIEIEGKMSRMPLTKTGYVRRDVQKACFRDPDKKASDDKSRIRYGNFIHGLTLDPFIYESLHRAFCGGYTHANPFHSGEVSENVASYDFASAYPSVMCSEYFPITPPELYDVHGDMSEFQRCLKLYCCVFTVTFYDLTPKVNYDHYLSTSHCTIPDSYPNPDFRGGPCRVYDHKFENPPEGPFLENVYQVNNGRVVSAKYLTTTITEVDWEIIIRCYDCKCFKVAGLIRWGRGYLPKPIIQSVIRYFQTKTQLKNVEGSEQEYMSAKENLNSIYGMMVMNPLRPYVPYDMEKNEWGQESGDRVLLEVPLTDAETIDALDSYNDSLSRFTYYAWGVYITAYCRKNLWRGILSFKDDYIYADTDSIKATNPEAHKEYIERHNENIQKKIKACLEYHKMDPGLSVAETPDHKKKPLGVWEYEGMYTRFKSLGAKRYMVEKVNKKTGGRYINITVSGINKSMAVPYILSQVAGPKRIGPEGGGDPFEFFDDQMEIPPGHAGKMIPYYGDDEITGTVRDYLGNLYNYHELSYVYMEPGGYSLKLAPAYVNYLDKLRKGLI